MVEIGPEAEKLLRRSLGRLQACIDQLVGQDVFVEAGGLAGMEINMSAIRRKVLELAQIELDNVLDMTEQRSPSADADGSEWLMRNLRP